MNKKFRASRLLAVLLCTAFLTSCSDNSVPQTNTASQSTASTEANTNSGDSKNAGAVTKDRVTYEKNDDYSDWKNENPNYIELKGNSASIKGSGAAVNGSKITITAAGVYALSGKLDNGQILVDVQDKGTVKLVLNGAEINSADNAPIYAKNAGKTIVSLQEGTQNVVTDGKNYVLADAATDEPSAAIFSKDNLTINGTGKLTVRANYKDGITSKDDLKITAGNIQIYSADDGIVGRDMIAVKGGNITIEATGDGIKSTNDTDAAKGFIALEGGTFAIKAGADGIQAETSLLITGGNFTVLSNGGSANGTAKMGDNRQNPLGQKGNATTTKTDETESQSAKGIKASADITISGGTFSIDSSDDAIHSNNSVTIAGGDISIASGDDGIHADSSLTIKEGKINIKKSYEGIESALITVSGGETRVISSDDGVNVAGGRDGSSVNGRPGQNSFSSSSNNKLTISGGYLSVDATGDGLDSNGSIAMTGGIVVVSGPTASNNGALDYDGTFEMSGGFLIAAGSAGMAQAPSEQSGQYSIAMNYSKAQQAGTLVHLKDSKGNTVVTFAPKKQYQAVVISSPELKKDTEYTLYSGGTSTGSSLEGLYTGGEYKDGTKIASFTISSSITWLSETGVTTGRTGNPGGPNGGGPNKGGFGGDRQGQPGRQGAVK